MSHFTGKLVKDIPVIRVFVIRLPAYAWSDYWGTVSKNSPHFRGSHPWTTKFPKEDCFYLTRTRHFLPGFRSVEMPALTKNWCLCSRIGARIHEPWRTLLNLRCLWSELRTDLPWLVYWIFLSRNENIYRVEKDLDFRVLFNFGWYQCSCTWLCEFVWELKYNLYGTENNICDATGGPGCESCLEVILLT
jgi:hypothetical protein